MATCTRWEGAVAARRGTISPCDQNVRPLTSVGCQCCGSGHFEGSFRELQQPRSGYLGSIYQPSA